MALIHELLCIASRKDIIPYPVPDCKKEEAEFTVYLYFFPLRLRNKKRERSEKPAGFTKTSCKTRGFMVI
jgi:hypothetical protein